MENITKSFPGVLANDHITLEIMKGEIHALLGENGAGKTTLMNILSGLYQPDHGNIYLHGKRVVLSSPAVAIKHGITMVHQHFMLVPNLSVTENIIVGMGRPRGPWLDLKLAEKEIANFSVSYGLEVDPREMVWRLPVGMQQRVEIIKALYRNANILVLDEPTSVLAPGEVRELFRILRRLSKDGHTVLFISHKLPEVLEISDRISVLRDGKLVGTVERAHAEASSLARLMVGREVMLHVDKPPASLGEEVLRVEGLYALNDKKLQALCDVSFRVHGGEILGVAGVEGNGQKELVETITGLRKASAGSWYLLGKKTTNLTPSHLTSLGVGHVPEDRQRMGLILDLCVDENAVLKDFSQPHLSKGFFLDFAAIERQSRRRVDEYSVKTPSLRAKARLLSGGHQQRLILARELSMGSVLLVAVQPTRGLDVAATEYVHRRLLEERQRGKAILLISTELDEVMALSDRIAVLFRGRVAGIVNRRDTNLEEIGLLMAGSKNLADCS